MDKRKMSKRALVRFQGTTALARPSDFLAPLRDPSGKLFLGSIKNGKAAEFGMVAYTGQNVTAEDFASKVVESDYYYGSADKALADMSTYVEELASFKIGTVLRLSVTHGGHREFELEKTNLKLNLPKRKLP